MATYTKEQIEQVCDKVSQSIIEFTDIQNTTFVTVPIIEGMENGKEFDEINEAVYNSICNIAPAGLYQTVGSNAVNGNPMLNVCQIVTGALSVALNELS